MLPISVSRGGGLCRNPVLSAADTSTMQSRGFSAAAGLYISALATLPLQRMLCCCTGPMHAPDRCCSGSLQLPPATQP